MTEHGGDVRAPGPNAERLRDMYPAFNEGDYGRAFEVISPDIEVEYRGVVIDAAGTYHGFEGLASLMRQILESFDAERFHIEPEEFVERGDRVVVALHQTAVGVSSGVPVDIRIGQLWTFRDGKAVRWEIYRDRDEAVAALEATAA